MNLAALRDGRLRHHRRERRRRSRTSRSSSRTTSPRATSTSRTASTRRPSEEIDALDELRRRDRSSPPATWSSRRRAFIEAGRRRSSAIEKLLALMESEGVDFDACARRSSGCGGIRVHVLGDTIVDSLLVLLADRAAPPRRRPSASSTRGPRSFAGGAAVVAKHLKAAGADVTFSTVLGDDAPKDFVLKDLEEAGVVVPAFIDRTRPTTQKERLHRRRPQHAQGRSGRQPADLGPGAAAFSASRWPRQPAGRRRLQRLPPRHLQSQDHPRC